MFRRLAILFEVEEVVCVTKNYDFIMKRQGLQLRMNSTSYYKLYSERFCVQFFDPISNTSVIYIYAFTRRFYPKRLFLSKVHILHSYQFLLSLGIESMDLMLQEPKLLFEQQERYLTLIEENYKSSNFFISLTHSVNY